MKVAAEAYQRFDEAKRERKVKAVVKLLEEREKLDKQQGKLHQQAEGLATRMAGINNKLEKGEADDFSWLKEEKEPKQDEEPPH